MRKPQPGWGKPAPQERKPGRAFSVFAAMPSLSTCPDVCTALVLGRLLDMIDDDHIVGGLRGPHPQAKLLLHGRIKVRRSLGIIAWRRYDSSGSSELRELRLIRSPFQLKIVFVLELGFIDHRFVHHPRLHPSRKIFHTLVSHREIPKRPEEEGGGIILSRRGFSHLRAPATFPDYVNR